jgi:hypothetical protein
MLVVTTVTPTGFLPNLVRRALAVKCCDPRLPFAERTERLVAMFAPHLSTMTTMTRSATDWVQDNMMNPAYFDLCLTIPDVLRELTGIVTAPGAKPSFARDWRWFNALHGDPCDFNGHMIQEYEAPLHNFLHYELPFSQSDSKLNREIEECCVDFCEAVRAYELGVLANETRLLPERLGSVTSILGTIILRVRDFPDSVRLGLQAGFQLLLADQDDGGVVARQSPFGRLFGRETVYLSMIADTPTDQFRSRTL